MSAETEKWFYVILNLKSGACVHIEETEDGLGDLLQSLNYPDAHEPCPFWGFRGAGDRAGRVHVDIREILFVEVLD